MSRRITSRTVTRLVRELRDAVDQLPDTPSDKWVEFVISCCERTRDIRLFAAPPNSVSPELTKEAVEVLSLTYDGIKKLDLSQVSESEADRISDYATNILGRLDIFRELAAKNEPADSLSLE